MCLIFCLFSKQVAEAEKFGVRPSGSIACLVLRQHNRDEQLSL